MFKQDAEFMWRLKRKFYNQAMWDSKIAGIGRGDGAPVELEVAASGISAVDLLTNDDSINTMIALPYDLDVSKHIYWRVLWSSADTDSSDTVDWIMTYTALIPGTTVLVTPATALTTTINTGNGGAQTVPSATADIPVWSAYGAMDPNDLTEFHELLAIEIEMGTQTGDPSGVSFHGLEIAYSRRVFQGLHGMKAPSPRMTRTLGSTQAPGDYVR